MDFSIRLARAAAIMTWISLAVGLVAATLMDQLGAGAGVHLHLIAFYLWTIFGAVIAALLSFLPMVATKSPFVVKNMTVFRCLLLVSETVWITADVAVSGGVRGPFWFCYLGVVLFAAVSLKAWQATPAGLQAPPVV